MRRRSAEVRVTLPDAKFGDIVLTKFINKVMVHGNKSAAEKVVMNCSGLAFGLSRSTSQASSVFLMSLTPLRKKARPMVDCALIGKPTAP